MTADLKLAVRSLAKTPVFTAIAILTMALGVQPVRGRTFTAAERQIGRDDVAIISARLWEGRFNSDAAVIGSAILLDGQKCSVVGVMPENFGFPRSSPCSRATRLRFAPPKPIR